MVGDLEIRTTIPIFAQRKHTRQTSHERQNSVRGFLLCVRCAFDNFRLSRRLIISYLYCLSFNPDGNLLDQGIETTAEDNGTFIKFYPDPDVFTGYVFHEGIVKEILQSIVRQNKGLTIKLNGAIVSESF